jgi:hypothetical protein
MNTTDFIAARAEFTWVTGLFCYENGLCSSAEPSICIQISLLSVQGVRLLGRRQDGVCQTPSYWGTRNRAFGTRHPARTYGSARPVLTTKHVTKLAVLATRFAVKLPTLATKSVPKLPVARPGSSTRLGVCRSPDFWYPSMRAVGKHPTVPTRRCMQITLR